MCQGISAKMTCSGGSSVSCGRKSSGAGPGKGLDDERAPGQLRELRCQEVCGPRTSKSTAADLMPAKHTSCWRNTEHESVTCLIPI